MAARRLIIVMVVLLGISTAIAIIVPEPKNNDDEPTTTVVSGTTGATGSTADSGATGPTGPDGPGPTSDGVVEEIVKPQKGKQLPTAVARPGNRLVLTVETATPTDVAIPDLGLTSTTTEYAPAVFDVVLPSASRLFDVIDVASGKLLARIISE